MSRTATYNYKKRNTISDISCAHFEVSVDVVVFVKVSDGQYHLSAVEADDVCVQTEDGVMSA